MFCGNFVDSGQAGRLHNYNPFFCNLDEFFCLLKIKKQTMILTLVSPRADLRNINS